MNQVEIKSFLRTFIPFFIILELLTATIFYKEYQNEVKNLEQTIAYNMKICNYHLDDEKYACHNYKIEFFNNKETFNHDFLEKKHKKINTLYKEENLIYQFFSIPKTPTKNTKQKSSQTKEDKPKTKSITLHLPYEQVEALDVISTATNRSRSQIVSDALEETKITDKETLEYFKKVIEEMKKSNDINNSESDKNIQGGFGM